MAINCGHVGHLLKVLGHVIDLVDKLTQTPKEKFTTDPRRARWDTHGRRRGGAASQRQLQLRLGQGQLGAVHTRTTPAASGEEARLGFFSQVEWELNYQGLANRTSLTVFLVEADSQTYKVQNKLYIQN